MRKLESEVPTLDKLGLPPIFRDIIKEKNGIVLVTGGTGTVIAANFIGTDISGSTAVPNGVGIRCDQGCVATVGVADAGNVISGNTGAGCEDFGEGWSAACISLRVGTIASCTR